MPIIGVKSYHRNVLSLNSQLMVSKMNIYLGKILCTLQLIKQITYTRQGYLLCIVTLFNYLQLIHNLNKPSFFFIKRIGVAYDKVLEWIKPLSNKSLSWCFDPRSSTGAIQYESIKMGKILGIKSIQKSIFLSKGSLSNSSRKTS